MSGMCSLVTRDLSCREYLHKSVALTNPCSKGYAINEQIHCYCSRLSYLPM